MQETLSSILTANSTTSTILANTDITMDNLTEIRENLAPLFSANSR